MQNGRDERGHGHDTYVENEGHRYGALDLSLYGGDEMHNLGLCVKAWSQEKDWMDQSNICARLPCRPFHSLPSFLHSWSQKERQRAIPKSNPRRHKSRKQLAVLFL